MPKISVVGEFFSVSLNSSIENVWIIGGGEYQAFPSKVFCLTLRKNSVGEPFCAVFQKISGSEKVYG